MYYVNHQACNRHQDGGDGHPDAGAAADVGVFGFCLVGRYVENVVLLHIIIRRKHQVGIVQVQFDNLPLACGILANEFHIVAQAIDGHVAGHSQGFKHIDFLIAHRESPGFGHFAQDRYFIIDHAHGHHGDFFQVGHQPLAYHGLGLALGQAAQVQSAQHREVDVAGIVHQIALQSRLCRGIHYLAAGHARSSLRGQVKGNGSLRVGGVHRDGKQVLGHDARIVKRLGACQVVHLRRVLQIRNFLVRCAAA